MKKVNREAFFKEFSELLIKHKMDNALIVYVGQGQVFNTTFNRVHNNWATALDSMSDVINDYFKQNKP